MRRLRLSLGLWLCAALAWGGEEPVAIRTEHFTVPPATGPIAHVVVQNRLDAPYRGVVRLRLPEGWQAEPAEQPVSLAPKESKRFAFTVAKGGVNLDSNSYSVEAIVTGVDGQRVARKQQIACASAPFSKPRIDGRVGDWGDAIPVTFVSGGKKTVLRTFWNREAFCLLVAVDEERLVVPRRRGAECDAVQVALSPHPAASDAKAPDKAGRYEFLLVPSASWWARDRCFLLATPDTPLAATQEVRELDPLELRGAKLAVKRSGGTTFYECSLPFAAMPAIAPAEGRELCFSLLVHDPDGTGLRDWGEAAGLWPWQRSRTAWGLWPGARWPKDPPFDNRIEWGLCSSKH